MKKRIAALLCVLALLFCLVPVQTGAAQAWFIALNDTLLDLTADTMPITSGGTVYVPCTVFDSRTAGVSMGVSYGIDKNAGTVSIYNKDRTAVFDIAAGIVTDYSTGSAYVFQAITRNGRYYVPVAAVCQLFGMSASNLSTDYGKLLRIKNGDVVLDDKMFVSSAALPMSVRLRQYSQENQTQEIQTSAETVQLPEENHSGIRVYLAVAASDDRTADVLDSLNSRNVRVLVLFRPEELAEQAALVRRAVGQGHQVGLLCAASEPEAAKEELRQGNELLAQIAHLHTYIVCAEGGKGVVSALQAEDWLCYQPNVSIRTGSRSSYSLASAVAKAVRDRGTSGSRILLDADAPAAAAGSLVQKLAQDGYEIRRLLETGLI